MLLSHPSEGPLPVSREVRVEAPARLDAALGMPARLLAELVATGHVRVVEPGQAFGRAVLSGRPWVPAGARALVLAPTADPRILPEDLGLELLHDDPALAVLAKPAGMATHAGPGHPAGTVANGLLGLPGPWSSVEAPFRPGLVHRLDIGTSGALVVARTDEAHRALTALLVRHEVRRRYLALVVGAPPWDELRVENVIGQRRRGRKALGSVAPAHGRAARTLLRVLARASAASVVEVLPETGRRHQIRVHLAEAGFPIVGDMLYGGAEARRAARRLDLDRPALHAASVGMAHPADGRALAVDAPLPPELATAFALAVGA